MFIDSNFFISAISDTGIVGERARTMSKTVTGTTSPLVIDEVAWKIKKIDLSIVKTSIKAIYNNPRIRVQGVHPLAGLEMIRLMEEHHLKPRDALHVAVMRAINETEILSNDDDFDHVPGIKRVAF